MSLIYCIAPVHTTIIDDFSQLTMTKSPNDNPTVPVNDHLTYQTK